MEGKMTAIDLAELVDQQIARESQKDGKSRSKFWR